MIDLEGSVAGTGEFGEITPKAVTEIHHASDRFLGGKPLSLCQAGVKSEMTTAGEGGAELAGDADKIAAPGAAAKAQMGSFHLSGECH